MRIYFSRCPIPYVRACRSERGARRHFKHIGLYVYRRDFLLGYSDLPVGPLEQAERLEQLRALENGFPFAWWKQSTNPSAWTRPRISRRVVKAFRSCRRGGVNIMAKYIFVTGGVVSSLGKGIAAASIGCLLESRGLQGHLPEIRSLPERRSRAP